MTVRPGTLLLTRRSSSSSHFNGADEVGFVNEYVKAQVEKVVKENVRDGMTDVEKLRAIMTGSAIIQTTLREASRTGSTTMTHLCS